MKICKILKINNYREMKVAKLGTGGINLMQDNAADNESSHNTPNKGNTNENIYKSDSANRSP